MLKWPYLRFGPIEITSGTRSETLRIWAFRIWSQNSFSSAQTKVTVKMVDQIPKNTEKPLKWTAHFLGPIFRPRNFFTQLIGIFYMVSWGDTAAAVTNAILPIPPLNLPSKVLYIPLTHPYGLRKHTNF